jgi:hypothetical protein
LEEAAGYLAAVEPTVVPRWEWRTFGASFSDVEARFESFPPERMAESDEIYLLSLATDASVKARGGLLDVKRLERVSEDGLELWRPVMKARFPLSADDVGSVMAALGAAVPPPARASTRSTDSSTRWCDRARPSARSRCTSIGGTTR